MKSWKAVVSATTGGFLAVAISLTCGCSMKHPGIAKDESTKPPVVAENSKGDAQMESTKTVYDFKAQSLDGKEIPLTEYKGDVLLIVNTASKCGYTPQYEGLQALYEKYKGKGLRVLGFPCNQFGKQEPGTASEIGSFCQKNYGVDFQMFEKIDVNGDEAHPLYKFLTHSGSNEEPIKWNFTKFLIDRHGSVVRRFPPDVKPASLDSDIEKLL